MNKVLESMLEYVPLAIPIAIPVVFVVSVFIILRSFVRQRRFMSRASSALGTIVKDWSESEWVSLSYKTRRYVVVRFSTSDGRTFEPTARLMNVVNAYGIETGREVEVRYAPENPAESFRIVGLAGKDVAKGRAPVTVFYVFFSIVFLFVLFVFLLMFFSRF